MPGLGLIDDVLNFLEGRLHCYLLAVGFAPCGHVVDMRLTEGAILMSLVMAQVSEMLERRRAT